MQRNQILRCIDTKTSSKPVVKFMYTRKVRNQPMLHLKDPQFFVPHQPITLKITLKINQLLVKFHKFFILYILRINISFSNINIIIIIYNNLNSPITYNIMLLSLCNCFQKFVPVIRNFVTKHKSQTFTFTFLLVKKAPHT